MRRTLWTSLEDRGASGGERPAGALEVVLAAAGSVRLISRDLDCRLRGLGDEGVRGRRIAKGLFAAHRGHGTHHLDHSRHIRLLTLINPFFTSDRRVSTGSSALVHHGVVVVARVDALPCAPSLALALTIWGLLDSVHAFRTLPHGSQSRSRDAAPAPAAHDGRSAFRGLSPIRRARARCTHARLTPCAQDGS